MVAPFAVEQGVMTQLAGRLVVGCGRGKKDVRYSKIGKAEGVLLLSDSG